MVEGSVQFVRTAGFEDPMSEGSVQFVRMGTVNIYSLLQLQLQLVTHKDSGALD